jgi:hypothetical protein
MTHDFFCGASEHVILQALPNAQLSIRDKMEQQSNIFL